MVQNKFISDKIAIIGVGLIGASVALAIKHKKLPFTVVYMTGMRRFVPKRAPCLLGLAL